MEFSSYWYHHRDFYLLVSLDDNKHQASTPWTTCKPRGCQGEGVLVRSHTSGFQCYWSREAPVEAVPMGKLCTAPMSAPGGWGAIFLCFRGCLIPNAAKWTGNHQSQHPHLAFSGSNALCYFKDLCKHFVNRENVDQAVMIRGGSSQRGTPCTFLKKLP